MNLIESLSLGIKGIKLSILLLAVVAVFGCTDQNAQEIYAINGKIMGTTYQVKVVTDNRSNLDGIDEAIHQALVDVDWAMSTYKSESELSKLNRAPLDEWLPISYPLLEVIAQSNAISYITDGAFDVTVGPLVNLWGFGPDRKPDTIPTEDQISEAKEKVGFEFLSLRQEPPSIKKSKDVYIDLSAIAKGYGVDRVAAVLEQSGFQNYLVEVGGEMKAKGLKTGDQPWVVGIEAPLESGRGVQVAVELDDLAIATSGDYRNYFEEAGVRYSHTIDSKTGKPINHRLASVTVFDTSAAKADGFATALMVVGPEIGMRLSRELDMAVFMIVRENDQFIEYRSAKFEELLKGN